MMYAKLALRNVRRTARDYLIYVVTLVLSVGMFYGFFSLVRLLQCDTSRTHPFRCTEENDADRGTIGGTFCSIFDVLC